MVYIGWLFKHFVFAKNREFLSDVVNFLSRAEPHAYYIIVFIQRLTKNIPEI